MQQGKRGIIYKYTSPSGKIYIGQTLNIYQGGICKVCKGKLKSAGGFIWKYKNNNNDNNE